MKVFHGISGAAGQPSSIAAALRRQGVDAVSFVVGENKYDYPSDRKISTDSGLHSSLFSLLRSELLEFDVFHFYFRPLFYDGQGLDYPTGLDLALLRLFGKRIILNFRGSEVRVHGKFGELSPFNYVAENPDDLVTKFPETVQVRYIQLASSICNHLLVPDPELKSYVPNAEIVPRSIDIDLWKPSLNLDRVRPLVVHAPSRRVVKGSDHVVQAANELQAEGLEFDFRLIEGLRNDEAHRIYQEADVIVDQLRIGWYGVLAVEGMALQKAVVSFVREDLLHHLGANPPLAVADPTSIKQVLRRLITDTVYREELSRRGRAYCENVHDSAKVARKLVGIYETEGTEIDQSSLLEFFSTQFLSYASRQQQTKADFARNEREISALKRRLSTIETKLHSADQKLDYVRRKIAPLLWLRDKFRRLRKGTSQ